MVNSRVLLGSGIGAVVLTASLVALWGTGYFASSSNGTYTGQSTYGSTAAPSNSHQGVAVHLFEWRYDDVADECVNFLGPSGVKYVQVSPPNESRDITSPWWNSAVSHSWSGRYQPVSYRINSRSGTEAMFTNMVQTCASAGVGVLVDLVVNHMAAGDASCVSGYTSQYCQNNACGTRAWNYGDSGTSCTGSAFSVTSYPNQGAVFNSYFNFPNYTGDVNMNSNFHHQATNPSGTANTCQGTGCNPSIATADYASNINSVRYNDLTGLSDLATETSAVQTVIGNYICYLMKIGVNAFRVDAAKHQAPSDIYAYFQKAMSCAGTSTWPFIYLEVIDVSGSEVVHATDYLPSKFNPSPQWLISDFGFERNMANLFKNTNNVYNLAWLAGGFATNPTVAGQATPGLTSSVALTFIANHDDERTNPSLVITQDFASFQFTAANIWMLTINYGFPLITSSYSWTRSCVYPLTGTSTTTWYNCWQPGTTDTNSWVGPPSDKYGSTLSVFARTSPSSASYPDGVAVPLSFNTLPSLCGNPSPPNSVTGGGWTCQHRWNAIGNAVGWRNLVNGGSGTLRNVWTSKDLTSFAYARDGNGSPCSVASPCSMGGWVAINNGPNTNSPSGGFTVGLVDGFYCNLWNNNYANIGTLDSVTIGGSACVNNNAASGSTGAGEIIPYNIIQVYKGLAYTPATTSPTTAAMTLITLQPWSGILIHTAAQLSGASR